MSDQGSKTAPLRRIPAFTPDDEDQVVPSAEQFAKARSAGERIGFVSEKATSNIGRGQGSQRQREMARVDTVQIRTTPEDRQRWEDFAYQHRVSKGEAFRMLLDLAENARETPTINKDAP